MSRKGSNRRKSYERRLREATTWMRTQKQRDADRAARNAARVEAQRAALEDSK